MKKEVLKSSLPPSEAIGEILRKIESLKRDLFYDIYGHTLMSCEQMSLWGGEVGKTHKKHLEHFNALIQVG